MKRSERDAADTNTGPTRPPLTGHTGVVHNCGYLDLVPLVSA